jgi:pimeloyl-ACP methyl ester carboxylesterase
LLVIAHSFGSYILSEILLDHPDIEFEKIILCGSIIPRNYEWDKHARGMRKNSILNDVGTTDIWPIFATCGSLGYGSSGRRGFQNASVTDRYFKYGHSDFFEPKHHHIKNFWKPFIETGEIVNSDWDQMKGKTSLFILAASHPWIGRPLLIGFLVAVYFGVKWLWSLF